MREHDNMVMDSDVASRTQEIFHWDAGKERGIIEDVQDVSAIIERNKGVGPEGFHKKAVWRPVGSMPMNLWHDLRRKWDKQSLSQDERQQAFKKWLNDKDNAVWKYDPSFKV